MAIAKLNKGAGFGGVLNYAIEKREAEFVSAIGVSSKDPAQIAREMRGVAGERLKEPVLHIQISLPHGEVLTKEKWQQVGKSWMNAFGADPENFQHVMVRHSDRQHDHMHLVINRVGLDGQVLSDSQDRRRSHESMRIAERETGISKYQKPEKRSQRGMMAELRQKIDLALDGKPSLKQFQQKLNQAGVMLKVNQSPSTGRISGISFAIESGKQIKGSTIGKDYSLAGLQRRGLDIGQEPHKNMKKEQSKGSPAKNQSNSLNMVTGHAERQRAAGEAWKAERAAAQNEDERRKRLGQWLKEKEDEDEYE